MAAAATEDGFAVDFYPTQAFGQGFNILAAVRRGDPSFGSRGLGVGERVTPIPVRQANDGCAYGDDSDEIRGHGGLTLAGSERLHFISYGYAYHGGT